VGDIAPRTNSLNAIGDGETSLWEAGAAAAMDAMNAWRCIKDLREVELHLQQAPIDLPYRPLTDLAEAQENLKKSEPRKAEPGEGMAEWLHWQAVIEAHSRPP